MDHHGPKAVVRIRGREAVFRLAAVLVDLDCTDTDRWTGRLALPFLRIELGIDEDDAIADDLPVSAHLVLPCSNTSQFRVRGW